MRFAVSNFSRIEIQNQYAIHNQGTAAFLGIARGSYGEVRSTMAVVKDPPKLSRYVKHPQEIRGLAESCARQLTAWAGSIEDSPVQGKSHLDCKTHESRPAIKFARDYRLNFLRNLKPTHPLYDSTEDRAARGEMEQAQKNGSHRQPPTVR